MGRFSTLLVLVLLLASSFVWGSDPPEWIEVQGRLQSLKARLITKETSVKELIRASQVSGKKETFDQLKQEYAELRTMADEYEKLRHQLRFRYPEKGLATDRRYQRIEVKSLNEMETQVGMESKLQSNLEKVRRQFQTNTPGSPEPRSPASAPKESSPSEEAVTLPAVMSR